MPEDDSSGGEQEAKRRRRRSKWDSDGAAGFGGPVGLAQSEAAAAFRRLAASAAARQLDIPRPRAYVGNLDPWVSEQEIMQIFSAFGTVTGIDMPREGMPPRSKGFCFVEFLEQKMADRAIATLQDFVLGGRMIRVGRPTAQKRSGPSSAPLPSAIAMAAGLGVPGVSLLGTGLAPALPSPASPPSVAAKPPAGGATSSRPIPKIARVLVLENLVAPGGADEDLAEEVREECGRFGEVDKVRVHEMGGERRVRVFARFKDPEAGGRAAESLNGRWFGGRQVRALPYSADAFAAGDLEQMIG